MAKTSYLCTYDSGIIIFDADTNEYWCNMNAWSKKLRKACIYHSMNWVQDVIKRFPDRNLKIAYADIRVTDIPQTVKTD